MLWPLIILVYLLFPILGYVQYKQQKSKGLEPDYTFQTKDLRSKVKVPGSIELMRSGLWALAVTVLSIIPFMGLPGGLFIELLHFIGLLPADKFAGEDLWPMALLLSFILPFGWPLAVWFRNTTVNSFQISSSILFWSVFLIWIAAILLLLIFLE
ncbi:MAG: hypothetical protein IPM92_04540 [Saprospiraceae bacterium]|nr:hypothetical protein [Saprospiraceae bacterium]